MRFKTLTALTQSLLYARCNFRGTFHTSYFVPPIPGRAALQFINFSRLN